MEGSICTTNDVTGAVTCTPTASPPPSNTATPPAAAGTSPVQTTGGAGPVTQTRSALSTFGSDFGITIQGIDTLATFKTALDNLEIEGTRQQKANAIKGILANLRSALGNTQSRYDLEKVKDVLEQRGLTLADIAALQGKNGEQLIAPLLTQLGLDPRQFESQTITDLNTLSALLDDPDVTAAQIKANPAFAALRDVEGEKLDIFPFAVIERANNKLAQLEEIESEAAAEAAAQAQARAAAEEQARLARIQARSDIQGALTLDNLLTALEKYKTTIDGNAELRVAFGNKALEILTKNPTISQERFEKLKPYLWLAPNQRLVSFTDGNARYIILIEGSDAQGWTIMSANLPDKRYYIKVENGKIIVGCEDGWPDPTFVSDVIDLPSPALSPVEQPTNDQLRIMFANMGIDFQAVMADGKIEWSEVEGHMSHELFDLIEKNMRVGESGYDGVLTQDELNRAASVISRYATVLGISVEEAVTKYNAAKGFKNVSLVAMAAASGDIEESLGGQDISTKEKLQAVLLDLGYSQDVIEAVIAFITDYQNLSAKIVAQCLMRVLEAGRMNEEVYGVKIDRDFPNVDYTKDNILAWLRGEAAAVPAGEGAEAASAGESEEPVDDNVILNDIRFKKIFSWDARFNRDQEAVKYVQDLIDEGNLALAERAIQLIMARAGESSSHSMPELENLEHNGSLQELFAVAYMQKGKYERALEHARKVTGSNKDQTLYNISQACITSITNDTNPAAVRARLELALTIAKEIQGSARDQALENLFNVCIQQKLFDLAYKIEEGWTSDSKRKERLQQLVEACRYSTDTYGVTAEDGTASQREVRQIALDAINLMVNLFGENALIEVEQNNQRVSIKLGDYKQQVTDELRMPLSIQIIKNGVLSRTEPPSIIGDAAAAITKLNGIIANSDGEVRAHALLVLAQILRAQADALWQQGVSGDPAKTDAFKMYELMARVSREAALAFAKLRDASTGSTAEYYNKMGIKSCDIIAEVVYANRNNWLERAKWGNPTRPSNWSQYLAAFKTLTKYIPKESTVTNFDRRGEGDSQYQSSMLFKRIVDLLSDQEQSDSYLHSHGYPENIADLYATITQ